MPNKDVVLAGDRSAEQEEYIGLQLFAVKKSTGAWGFPCARMFASILQRGGRAASGSRTPWCFFRSVRWVSLSAWGQWGFPCGTYSVPFGHG